MTDQFITPDSPEQSPEDDKRRKTMIGVGIGLVVLCCCCATLGGLWFYGDQLMQTLGF